MTSSEKNKTSSDLLSDDPITFESWMGLLRYDYLFDHDQALFLKGLQDHPDWLNQTNAYQETPLILASEFGHMDMVKVLIEAGADLNVQDQWVRTALIRAAREGKTEVVQALVRAGVEINHQDQDGWTSLMWSVYRGKMAVVKTLIQAGADLNLQNQEGWTALMWAAIEGREKMIEYLTHQGVNPLVLNEDHDTALDLARKAGEDVVFALLERYVEAYVSKEALNQALSSLEPSPRGVSSNKTCPSSLKGLRL